MTDPMPSPAQLFPSSRAAVAAALLASLALPGPARADCNSDFGAIMAKRMAAIGALNSSSKGGGGKLDPISACPRLRALTAIEGELVSYIEKNKAWCNMPDDLADKMSATRAKTASIAAKACSFAVKMKQMQQQQASQQAQQAAQQPTVKLPAGPL